MIVLAKWVVVMMSCDYTVMRLIEMMLWSDSVEVEVEGGEWRVESGGGWRYNRRRRYGTVCLECFTLS